jgi:hypothetical protein
MGPPPSRPPIAGVTPPAPKPQKKRAPLHPLEVDWSRPLNLGEPKPRAFPPLYSRWSRVLPSLEIEEPDPQRLLEDQLKGPADPEVVEELGDLMWKQLGRVWRGGGCIEDPLFSEPISEFHAMPSSPSESGPPTQLRPETVAMLGPALRTNESTHLGEGPKDPNSIILGDDEDGGFEEVLDLYHGAVQGSSLSRELELALEDDVEHPSASWEGASGLQVSIRSGSPVQGTSGESQESRVRTVAQPHPSLVETEKGLSLPKAVVPEVEPPLGIEWSYHGCGYATGRVVNLQKAKMRR